MSRVRGRWCAEADGVLGQIWFIVTGQQLGGMAGVGGGGEADTTWHRVPNKVQSAFDGYKVYFSRT